MKKEDLKDLCRERSLKVSGAKSELIRRLMDQRASEAGEPVEEEDDSSRLCAATERVLKRLDGGTLDIEAMGEITGLKLPRPGEIVKGTVTSVQTYGAFVELDGIGWNGLVHISEVTEEFIDCIDEYVQPGQRVECLVIRSPGERGETKLSLSMRRLQNKAAKAAYEMGAGILADQIEQARAENAKKESLSPSPAPTPRISAMTDSINRLEARIEVMEGVLIQLGHGEALRRAQSEAVEGGSKMVVPPLETMLAGLPDENGEKPKRMTRKEAERIAIDQILADLAGEADGEVPSLNDIDTALAKEERMALSPDPIEDVNFGVDELSNMMANSLRPDRRKG